MGLDMWLNRKSNEEEIMYWRKADMIRNWFSKLNNFEDNGVTIITKVDLENLFADIEKVLHEPDKAAAILPTTRDLYLDSATKYSEYYFSTLESTREELKNLLMTDKESELYEYVEWY